MTVLLGGIYPLLVTIIAYFAMPDLANGSFLRNEDKVIGSSLIAQKFTKDEFFWPRPSAIEFNPIAPSGGSNLGPISRKLKSQVEERAKVYGQEPSSIPSDLLYASGSGLDPHITLDAAYFQMERIAKARSMENTTALKALIDSLTEGLEIKYVNVLRLNQELKSHD